MARGSVRLPHAPHLTSIHLKTQHTQSARKHSKLSADAHDIGAPYSGGNLRSARSTPHVTPKHVCVGEARPERQTLCGSSPHVAAGWNGSGARGARRSQHLRCFAYRVEQDAASTASCLSYYAPRTRLIASNVCPPPPTPSTCSTWELTFGMWCGVRATRAVAQRRCRAPTRIGPLTQISFGGGRSGKSLNWGYPIQMFVR